MGGIWKTKPSGYGFVLVSFCWASCYSHARCYFISISNQYASVKSQNEKLLIANKYLELIKGSLFTNHFLWFTHYFANLIGMQHGRYNNEYYYGGHYP